jgi:transglutaminase-like putative cysteine protease
MPLIREERRNAVDRFFDAALLALLLSGYFALASSGEVDPITLTLTGAAFAGRLALYVWQRRLELPAAWANAAVILYAAFYPLDYGLLSQDFLAATVRMICFLTVAKGLTVVTNRDALYAVLIAFAELLAAALLSASLFFLLFLALFLAAGVATFASWQIRLGAQFAPQSLPIGNTRFPARLLATTLSAAFFILLFTVGMFFVLPRTARAAFQNLVSSRYHLPGFSGNVRLGDIGAIQTSSRTMMHIRIEGPAPEILPHKWRGTALTEFDGQRWTQRGGAELLRFQYGSLSLPVRGYIRRNGTRLRYQVQHSDSALDSLFIAGVPEFIDANLPSLLRHSSGGLRAIGDNHGLLRYSASSFLDASLGDGAPAPNPDERRLLLSLPPLNPRIADLARTLTANEPDDWRRARRLETWLQTNLAYTLELPATTQSDPIAHFLFERRRGHCEYFASAHAVMLRSLGIPARVVTGFQGGVRNPVSGWHVIAASDAHSWVEAWIPNNGWTTFDPTPAGGRPAHAALFQRLSHLIDAADLFWQEWVIQYDLERQFKLASAIENNRFADSAVPSLNLRLQQTRLQATAWLQRYGLYFLLPAVFAALVWVLAPWLRTRHQERLRRTRLSSGAASQSDASIMYRQLLDLLEKQNLRKPAWYTPLEFARVLPPSETANLVAGFTHAYNRFRFGADRAAAQQMLELYDAIDRQLRQPTTPET